MQKVIILILVLVFYVEANAQSISGSFTHGGVNREYRVYLPTNYNAGNYYPVVFNLHGYGSNGVQQQIVSNMNAIADTANFIVVYPEGTEDLTFTQFWNANYGASVDDISFLNALLDTLIVNYSVNKHKVYSTGHSNGAIMSYTLACESAGRFAAVAGVAGIMAIGQYTSCAPTRSVSVLHIHGTADATVQYTGNSLLIAVDTLVAFWANHNDHTSVPSSAAIPNNNILDGATAERFEYEDNLDAVHLIKVTGGRHTWPGASVQAGWGTCMDFDASVEIWNFFNQFSLPTTIQKLERSEQLVQLLQNPVQNELRWTSTTIQDYSLQITNILGKEVLQKNYQNGGFQNIDISSLQAGIYIATFRVQNRQQSIQFVVNQ